MDEQLGHQRRGRQEMLEVVEHEQQAAATQAVDEPLAEWHARRIRHSEGLGDSCGDQVGIAERGERDEGHAVSKVAGQGCRNRERQPRLTGATGAGEGQQADVVLAKKRLCRRQLLLAAEERCAR